MRFNENKYRLALDELVDDIFYELEDIGESGHSHECVVGADNEEHAAEIVTQKLKNFFTKKI